MGWWGVGRHLSRARGSRAGIAMVRVNRRTTEQGMTIEEVRTSGACLPLRNLQSLIVNRQSRVKSGRQGHVASFRGSSILVRYSIFL
jgi:hypothetical protein